ncbi:MAG: flagellar biosynthetic protein FliR [bacterium]
MPVDLIALLSPTNLILFIVVLTRLSGLMTTAPLISTYPIPMQIKTWLMAMVAFIMFPIVLAKTGFQMPTSIPELSIILLKEFMIGYIIGFVANVVFIGVEIAADLISMQMGLTASQALNPMTGDTSPILSQAYTILASMIFIGLNGYQWLFAAVYKTFQIMPPGYEITISGTFVQNVIFLTSQIFVVGLGIALPIFSVLVITDVLLGFVSKMMPNMNIFMVALPVKIYMGLLLFVMLIPLMYSQLQVLIEKYLASIITILGG